MTTTMEHNQPSSPDRGNRSHRIHLGNLARDLTLLGPAPTLRREAVVLVISLIGVSVALRVTQPPVREVKTVVACAAAVFAVRAAVGSRKWGQR
ncbi:MAG: hypothetical protein ACOH2Q_18470 [Rhodococcus sp. (in: high G+C Gram-positive bacteria)]